MVSDNSDNGMMEHEPGRKEGDRSDKGWIFDTKDHASTKKSSHAAESRTTNRDWGRIHVPSFGNDII